MSKIITLEVVDILDGITVLETESGFEVEIDTESLPSNLKIGQTLKCAISLNVGTTHRELYIPTEEEYRKKLPNGKLLSY